MTIPGVTLRTAPDVARARRRAADAGARRGLPRLPRGYAEPKAVARLAAAELPPVLVLQAPRGFGKTAAISWLLRQDEESHHDHVWVNLPHREVTAEEFWDAVRRRLGEAALENEDWSTINRVMSRRRRRLVVVVDDLDRVAGTGVDDELADLAVKHDHIHVIATSRRPRPLQTVAVALDGLVLRSGELRLGGVEVERMAAQLGIELTPVQAGELAGTLRGWPALLRSILGETVRVVDGRVHVDQAIVDRYIRIQASDMPDAVALRTLTTLAVPAELHSELRSELVSQDELGRLEHSMREIGIVDSVSPSDLTAHEPLRRALERMLAEDDPAAYQQVSRTSARWFAAHGQHALALRHAVAAEDWDLTAELLTGAWAPLLADHPVLSRVALDRLPAAVVNASAQLVTARDYILNVATEGRARSAYAAGLLMPDGAARARIGRRLSLRQVLSLHSNGLYDTSRHLVENRRIGDAISEIGWSEEVVQGIPELLLEWSIALLLGNPGVGATYAFCETAAWAEHLGLDALRRDAAAGAALSHAVVGYPSAAQVWLDLLDSYPEVSGARLAPTAQVLTRAVIGMQTLRPRPIDLGSFELPPELADLEVLLLELRASSLMRQGRAREAVRLLESYRVRPGGSDRSSLVEHSLVTSLVEAHLASAQVERARRVLLEVDPEVGTHRASWALVDFQSGEYERVLVHDSTDDLLPRQTLQLALLRACAALRLQQRPAAIDAFQAAVSTSTQTGMLRPFALVPTADLAELSEGDAQVRELFGRGTPNPLMTEPQDGSGLSPRELQVLEVVATGASFAAVASRLFVSPNTVKSQMRDIYRKLGVRGREHAVERARELGLLRR